MNMIKTKMGNILSSVLYKKKHCFICNKQIGTTDITKCVRCNILLHDNCEIIYRNTRDYCKCPNCQKIGSLGKISNIV